MLLFCEFFWLTYMYVEKFVFWQINVFLSRLSYLMTILEVATFTVVVATPPPPPLTPAPSKIILPGS